MDSDIVRLESFACFLEYSAKLVVDWLKPSLLFLLLLPLLLPLLVLVLVLREDNLEPKLPSDRPKSPMDWLNLSIFFFAEEEDDELLLYRSLISARAF